MERKLLIKASGAKVEFKFETDTKTQKKIKKHYTGIVQLEVISTGDFGGLDAEKLEKMITNYFGAHRDIILYDLININGN